MRPQVLALSHLSSPARPRLSLPSRSPPFQPLAALRRVPLLLLQQLLQDCQVGARQLAPLLQAQSLLGRRPVDGGGGWRGRFRQLASHRGLLVGQAALRLGHPLQCCLHLCGGQNERGRRG